MDGDGKNRAADFGSISAADRNHEPGGARKAVAIQPWRPSLRATRVQAPAVSSQRTRVPGGRHSAAVDEESGRGRKLRQGSAACRTIRVASPKSAGFEQARAVGPDLALELEVEGRPTQGMGAHRRLDLLGRLFGAAFGRQQDRQVDVRLGKVGIGYGQSPEQGLGFLDGAAVGQLDALGEQLLRPAGQVGSRCRTGGRPGRRLLRRTGNGGQ